MCVVLVANDTAAEMLPGQIELLQRSSSCGHTGVLLACDCCQCNVLHYAAAAADTDADDEDDDADAAADDDDDDDGDDVIVVVVASVAGRCESLPGEEELH